MFQFGCGFRRRPDAGSDCDAHTETSGRVKESNDGEDDQGVTKLEPTLRTAWGSTPGAIRSRSPKTPASPKKCLDQPTGRGCNVAAFSVSLDARCLNVVDRFCQERTPVPVPGQRRVQEFCPARFSLAITATSEFMVSLVLSGVRDWDCSVTGVRAANGCRCPNP